MADYRINKRTPIRLRGRPRSSEEIFLPQGAYVKIIRSEYLPKDFDVHFLPSMEVVVYSQYGLGVVLRSTVEEIY